MNTTYSVVQGVDMSGDKEGEGVTLTLRADKSQKVKATATVPSNIRRRKFSTKSTTKPKTTCISYGIWRNGKFTEFAKWWWLSS